ncbi:GNAT family N-acetyltransferase [Cellulomonas fengjieae]|uniref:GNAT family N-acetyltransferase n=1 Tax=Cellulomonas fengjieae TaxID=2819978 RepID=A0ABS3SDU6_9CELL|nr:GNAT family N-acetyltransferase [Cellulomonas fengjieae]MBO3083919.1 GNAT family N-acetyltransferase [Cellulomonas fengjieae]QVI64803.1 GNAT family N-acetyltransferase [Cellulomonas fengjieae]
MPLDVSVDAATAADSPAIRTVLARAYRANPLMVWALPDEATREDACAAWLGPSVDRYLAVGRVDVARLDGGVVGVAAWRLPGAPPPPVSLPSPAGVLAALVGRGRAREVLEALGSAAALAPAAPAAYLNYLAVEPALQRRAVGRLMVEQGVAAADAGRIDTYLGTTDARNLPFYRRLGYRSTGAVRLEPDGPVLEVLHRPQGTASSANHMTVSP